MKRMIFILCMLMFGLSSARVIAPLYVEESTQKYDIVTAKNLFVEKSRGGISESNIIEVLNDIDMLRSSVDNSIINKKVMEWLACNINDIDLITAGRFFSRYDLSADPVPSLAIKEISTLYDYLSDNKKIELLPILVQLKTKYNLLKTENEPEIMMDVDGLSILVVDVDNIDIHVISVTNIVDYSSKIHWMNVNGVVINGISVNGVVDYDSMVNWMNINDVVINGISVNGIADYSSMVNWMNVNGISVNGIADYSSMVNWIDIPTNSFIVTKIDDSTNKRINQYQSLYDKLIYKDNKVMVIPHPNSLMGMRYKVMNDKLKAAGSDWIYDEELRMEWELYWEEVILIYDKIDRMNKSRL